MPDTRRLLFHAVLEPVQGHRFQPTGFPDIGAATYQSPDGVEMLLVESAQSMANRLESVCWDPGRDELVPALEGLPYVRVSTKKGDTNSILEAHRLNSVYIKNSPFFAQLEAELGYSGGKRKEGPLPAPELARVLLRHDPNSVVHGIFLEKIAGTLRLPRLLSSFIEAEGVRVSASGGVKNDRLDASGKTADGGKGAAQGYGNVPFHRAEYTAQRIRCYINLDLGLLRSYGLSDAGERLLYTLALWKVRRLLDGDLRLRAACDLEATELVYKRPEDFRLPGGGELDAAVGAAIASAREQGLLGQVVRVQGQD